MPRDHSTLARRFAAALAAVAAVAWLCGCGAGDRTAGASPPSGPDPGGRLTMVMARAPRTLDPAGPSSAQGTEAEWDVYTGLTAYRHANGSAGTRLIPGLAMAMPTIGAGGRTYTATLRPGLRFSDGRRVRASDFPVALERAIRLSPDGPGRRIVSLVTGARAFADGRAATISGIVTDDATRRITIQLRRRDGAFDALLATPALGLVGAGTSLRPLGSHPPAGVGPYRLADVVPGRSFVLRRNPLWRGVPGIKAGRADVDVRISPDASTDALSVLNDVADVFDPLAAIAPGRLAEIRRDTGSRFTESAPGSTLDYVFLNARVAPFDRRRAREAVITGLDEAALIHDSAGTVVAQCELLPPTLAAGPPATCPYRGSGSGDLAAARRLVTRSGTSGSAVAVLSPSQRPERGWMRDYVSVLDAIGFRARLRVLRAREYARVISTPADAAQTGVASFAAVPPGAPSLYRLLDGHAIHPAGNENLGELDDRRVDAAIAALSRVPATDGAAVAAGWRAVAGAAARKADGFVIGAQRVPRLTSARVDTAAMVVSPVFGLDPGSLRLR